MKRAIIWHLPKQDAHGRSLRHVHRADVQQSVSAFVGSADENRSNIMRAFDAGWGGVVTKTIGLHPVINVKEAEVSPRHCESPRLSMQKRPGAALHSSWNWELISDKTLDWWIPRIERIKAAHPNRILVASIMAGSGSDRELSHWQTLATACQAAGAVPSSSTCPVRIWTVRTWDRTSAGIRG